mmetsp:Transcript_39472/g.109654  ORF Transcript_39472/g.109654 Transcript_39472/m.109654 type:complete len:251 (-) Transcript_39472:373-1125(-)
MYTSPRNGTLARPLRQALGQRQLRRHDDADVVCRLLGDPQRLFRGEAPRLVLLEHALQELLDVARRRAEARRPLDVEFPRDAPADALRLRGVPLAGLLAVDGVPLPLRHRGHVAKGQPREDEPGGPDAVGMPCRHAAHHLGGGAVGRQPGREALLPSKELGALAPAVVLQREAGLAEVYYERLGLADHDVALMQGIVQDAGLLEVAEAAQYVDDDHQGELRRQQGLPGFFGQLAPLGVGESLERDFARGH